MATTKQDHDNMRTAEAMRVQITGLLQGAQTLGKTLTNGDVDEILCVGDALQNAEYHLKRVASGFHKPIGED